jgi:hypothetical protein
MPWVVGIDEAGYGPNLGPLAQTAVAVRLPDADPAGWRTLRPHVRRFRDKADRKRVLIDDSKLVHQGPNALARLERGVAAAVGVAPGPLGDWLRAVALPEVLDDLAAEPWYDPADPVPLSAGPFADLREELAALGVEARVVGAKLVCPAAFNQVANGSGSKATVLTVGMVGLLGALRAAVPAGEPVLVVGDKHGGRNHYGPALQGAFPDGWVVAERESADESRYRVERLGREVTAVFRPRAEADSVSVALASMLAKYLREVCMRQFNRFWAGHVPGLRPTAGYPTDARRFYGDIRPAMAKLGIPEESVWRAR